MHHPHHLHRRRREQVEKVLARMGGTHTLADILALIEKGDMQSFSDGDTWVVTQVLQLPRKRVLEVFMVIGTLEGMRAIEPAVMDFAKQLDVGLVRAFGRDGWKKEMKTYAGWKSGLRIFMKEV